MGNRYEGVYIVHEMKSTRLNHDACDVLCMSCSELCVYRV